MEAEEDELTAGVLMKSSLQRCRNFISLMLDKLKTVYRRKAELNTEVAPARTLSTSQPPRGPYERNRIIWPQKHTPSAPEWKRAEALSRTKYAFQTFRGSENPAKRPCSMLKALQRLA